MEQEKQRGWEYKRVKCFTIIMRNLIIFQIDIPKHSKICTFFKCIRSGKCQQEIAERVKVNHQVERRKM